MSLKLLDSLKSLRFSKSLAGLAEWHSNNMGYRKLGLFFDDLMPSETPIAAEAIRRLTPSEYYERLFRIRRALNLSMKKMELSKDQWTTKEQDVAYLRPIVEQVEKEVSVRQEFDNMSRIPEALLKRNRL